jgi:hypothetical protein
MVRVKSLFQRQCRRERLNGKLAAGRMRQFGDGPRPAAIAPTVPQRQHFRRALSLGKTNAGDADMPISTEDYVAVSDHLARYCWGVDEGDEDGWIALWTEDGVFTGVTPEPVVGRENLRQVVRMGQATIRMAAMWCWRATTTSSPTGPAARACR